MEHGIPETLFSLARDVPAREPDDPGVDSSRLERASLAQGSIRQLCSLRKLAEGGAVLHSDTPLAIGEMVALELTSGHRIAGEVIWRDGASAGIRFDRPIDLLAVIARNLVNQPGERRRLPRIELDCAAGIETNGVAETARIRDVSQGGVRVDTALTLAPGDAVRMAIDGMRPLEGRVAWAQGQSAGVSLEPELNWQELMPWLRAVRDAVPTVPPAPPLRPNAIAAAGGRPAIAAQGVRLNIAARVREGTSRWNIEVRSIDSRKVEFESFAALRLGSLLWVVLPGLEGWSGRVTRLEGHVYTCEFTHPLHPAVLERILAGGEEGQARAVLN